MGPGWFLSADQFWKQGGCDEGHGSWGQQGVEVALKAWLSGNALMVNKLTWFAHWFRGDEGFPYPISGREVDAARHYSRDLWLNNKWPGQVRDLRWLINKFNPPGWEGILKHGMYHQRKGLGVDESVMWGEYFFVEALAKALGGGIHGHAEGEVGVRRKMTGAPGAGVVGVCEGVNFVGVAGVEVEEEGLVLVTLDELDALARECVRHVLVLPQRRFAAGHGPNAADARRRYIQRNG